MNKTYFFLCAKKVESYFDNFVNGEPEKDWCRIHWLNFRQPGEKKKRDKETVTFQSNIENLVN